MIIRAEGGVGMAKEENQASQGLRCLSRRPELETRPDAKEILEGKHAMNKSAVWASSGTWSEEPGPWLQGTRVRGRVEGKRKERKKNGDSRSGGGRLADRPGGRTRRGPFFLFSFFFFFARFRTPKSVSVRLVSQLASVQHREISLSSLCLSPDLPHKDSRWTNIPPR